MANINIIGIRTDNGDTRQLNPGDIIVDTDQNQLFIAFTAAQARQSSATMFADTTPALLNFQTTDFDTGAFYNGGLPARLTVINAGTYKVTASIGYASNATGSRNASVVQFNNASVEQRRVQEDIAASSLGVSVVQATGIFEASAGDYFSAEGEQDSGGMLNSDIDQTWFFIQRLN